MLILASASASHTRASMPGLFSKKMASCLVICITLFQTSNGNLRTDSQTTEGGSQLFPKIIGMLSERRLTAKGFCTQARLGTQGEFKNRRKSRSRRGNGAEVVFAPKFAAVRRRLPFLNTPAAGSPGSERKPG